MADLISLPALGRFAQWYQNVLDNSPANSAIVIIALDAAEADDDLRAHATFADLLGAAGNDEADFTNYARVVFTDADAIARTVDAANNRVDVDVPDWTYSSAGGAANNNLAKIAAGYDPDSTSGTDADILVMHTHDFVQATNGGDVDASVDAAGIARASG